MLRIDTIKFFFFHSSILFTQISSNRLYNSQINNPVITFIRRAITIFYICFVLIQMLFRSEVKTKQSLVKDIFFIKRVRILISIKQIII